MIYDFDSYLLYEYTKNIAYTVRIKVTLKELVDSVILKKSAEKAFERFPYFHKKAILDENGGYRLEENDQPIVVSPESSKAPVLGGKEANDYFFSITYAGKDLYFNFSHSFCGACGAMFWVKSTIW